VLGALSTGHKTAILVVAAVFIVFALCSSFVFSRMNPNFPGRRLVLFIAVCVLLTAAMLGAVIALASEPPERRAESEQARASTRSATSTAAAPPAAPAGDAAAGKELFVSQGCSACHTFGPAASTGTTGPDLDHLAADAQKANRGSLEQYTRESIVDPGAYVVPKYPDGVMPPNFGSLGPKKIADLVAFLTSGS
jgi:mono/diheme cytochrome c family protein